MEKGKYWLSSFLLLVVLTSSFYFVLNDNVRIDIQETKSIFKVYEDGSWIISGVEYVNLFDGTAKMRAKERSVSADIFDNTTIITRTALYKDGILVVERYFFDGNNKDVELFPVNHSIEIIGADRPERPFILQYEVQKLLYTGETIKDIESPRPFGHKMKIEWESGNYYSRIYKYKDRDEGKLTVKYKIDSNDYSKNVRLFDPPEDITVTLNSPVDNYYDADGDIIFNCSANTTGGEILTNLSFWTNSTGTWTLNDSVNAFTSKIYDEIDDSSINTSLWTSYTTGATSSNVETSYIESLTTGNNGNGESYVQSKIIGNLASINNITTQWEGYAYHESGGGAGGDDAYSRLYVFGNLIKEIRCSGGVGCSEIDSSVWKVIKNESAGENKFDIYNDDIYNTQITATNNILKSQVYHNSESSDDTTGRSRLYYVYYTISTSSEISNRIFNINISASTKWSCQACDNNSDCNFAENRTVFLDEQNPLVEIVYPDNITYTTDIVQLNYIASDSNPDKCWYSNDSGITNYSIVSSGTNFTNVISNDGSNTWTVYCNDTVGYGNSSSVTFLRDISYPLIEYSANSDTSNLSGDFTKKDWVWINVSVTETNVANVTFWTWTSTNSSFDKTTFINQADTYTLNQTGLSKDVYFWNVTVCDVVGQCNTTETRNYGVEEVNLSIELNFSNIIAELGGDILINATNNLGNIYVDVDHPDYGINYSSGYWKTGFDLIIDYFKKFLFDGDTSYQELNYSAGFGTDEIKTFNLSAHQYDEIVSVGLNITGTNNPLGVVFYKANSTEYDRAFFGNLTDEGYINQDKLIDKSFSPYGYNTTQDISFDNAGEQYLYFLMDNNAKLISFLFNVTSIQYGFDFSENYEDNTYTDLILSTAQITGGFLMPLKSSPLSFIYDTFNDASINTTLWNYTADVNIGGGGTVGYDLLRTTTEASGKVTVYQEIERFGGHPASDTDGRLTSNFYSNVAHFDLRTIDALQINYDYSYDGREQSIYSGNYGFTDCNRDLIVYVGDQQIWKANEEGCDYDDLASCHELSSTTTPLTFYLTKQINSSWLVEIVGVEYTYSTSGDGACGDYFITTNWTAGTEETTYDSCAASSSTVDNEFYITPNYNTLSPLVFYMYSRADFEGGGGGGYGCDNLYMYSSFNFVNNTRSSYSNSSYYSSSIFDSSDNIASAAMTSYGENKSSSIFFYLSGNNGDNWQNVPNGQTSPIINTGQHMKYRIDFNLTETGYLESAPYISSSIINTTKGNVSDVYFDVGADGSVDYFLAGNITAANGSLLINLSNASLTNSFSGTSMVGQTYYVPVTVNSSSAGGLGISAINLSYNPNPVYLNFSAIQNFLTFFGSGKTTIPITLESSGINSIINLTGLLFDYAGGEDTIEVMAHNIDYSQNVSRNITYYYSRWDYEWVPTGVEWIYFAPTKPTSVNVTPYGQSSTIPIINITNYGYGGRNTTLSIWESGSNPCVDTTINTNSTKPIGTTTALTFMAYDDFESDSGHWATHYGVNCPDSAAWGRGWSTPSSDTGPQSGGTHFIYVETSAGDCYDIGDAAIVEFNTTINYDNLVNEIITFYFNAYGSEIDSLYLQENSTGSWVTLWEMQDINNDYWNFTSVDLSSLTGSGTLRFNYTRTSTGYYSDIALDRINVTYDIEDLSEINILGEYWTTIASDLDYLDSVDIYLWADYNCSFDTWNLFEPQYYFRQCVDGGSCSIDLI